MFLGLGGVSSGVELDYGIESRRVERSIRAHLQQVDRSEGGEDVKEPILNGHTAASV